MNKIKYVSLFFTGVFQLIFFSLPILLILSWIYAPEPLVLLHGIIQDQAIPSSYLTTHSLSGIHPKIMHSLTFDDKLFGFFLSMIHLFIQLFILHCLIKLFGMFSQGNIFSIDHVRYLRNLGYTLLIGQCFEPIYQLLMGIILTFKNPPGHRFMSITLDQTNIALVLTALIVILISWIMAEGFKMYEEQQLTV